MKKVLSILLVIMLLTGLAGSVFAADDTEVLGELYGQTYLNEFFGFQFRSTPEWYLLNAEETTQMMGFVMDTVLTDEDLAEALEESGTVYAFMAQKLDGSNDTVNAALQNTDVLYTSVSDQEEIIDMIQQQLEPSLGSVGYENLDIVRDDVVFAGEKRPSFQIKGTYADTTIYEREILIFKDTYLCAITCASGTEDRTDEIAALFQAADHEAAETVRETAAVMDDALLLANQGKGLEAMEKLKTAYDSSKDPALEAAMERLENSQWKLEHQVVYKSDGSVLLNYIYEYDEDGKLTVTTSLDADGKVTNKQVNEYGKDGFYVGRDTYDGDGNLSYHTDITCDDLGNPHLLKSDNSTTEYVPNQYGDNTITIFSDADGEETNRTYRVFDEYGMQTITLTVSGDDTILHTYDNKYDFNDAEKTLRVTIYQDGAKDVAAEYDYTYIPLQ